VSPPAVFSEGGPPPTRQTTIIRYPNRRLYDRSQGRYVTLQDIEDAVRQGVTVTVRDSKTGEDLTRLTLAQILLERHPERMDLFPASFLHLALRANEVMLTFLREHVRQSLAYAELMQRAAPFGPLLAPAEWMRTLLPGNTPQDTRDDAAMLDALTRRIAELERRIEELQAAPDERRPGAAGEYRQRRGRKNEKRKPD
jgi:polyhydroxyalkanoate synthesis repressor PhaR